MICGVLLPQILAMGLHKPWPLPPSPLRIHALWNSYWRPLEGKSSISWWYQVASRVSIIPVSSADVERVVSVFTDVVGDDQASMIEETIEATVITRFNHRTPKPRKQRRFCDDDKVISDEEGDKGAD